MLSFPFGRADGLEIGEEVADRARQNLETFVHEGRTTIYHANAENFDQYARYTHFYLYNPFPEKVLAKVVSQILAQHAVSGVKTLTIIYNYPSGRNALMKRGFSLKSVHEGCIHVYTLDTWA